MLHTVYAFCIFHPTESLRLSCELNIIIPFPWRKQVQGASSHQLQSWLVAEPAGGALNIITQMVRSSSGQNRAGCICRLPVLISSLPPQHSAWRDHLGSQFSSVAQSCPTLCNPMDCSTQASLPITNSQSLLKLTSVESVMPSNHLILCRPLLLLPSIFPSIRVFSNESVLHTRWPKYWSFSFSICTSSEYSGLISFRMDWLDLLAVQGTLKSLLQHHSSKASIPCRSVFFIVQLSHPYMTTGKTIALPRRTFVDNVMSPLFNMLSRLEVSGKGLDVGGKMVTHWFLFLT